MSLFCTFVPLTLILHNFILIFSYFIMHKHCNVEFILHTSCMSVYVYTFHIFISYNLICLYPNIGLQSLYSIHGSDRCLRPDRPQQSPLLPLTSPHPEDQGGHDEDGYKRVWVSILELEVSWQKSRLDEGEDGSLDRVAKYCIFWLKFAVSIKPMEFVKIFSASVSENICLNGISRSPKDHPQCQISRALQPEEDAGIYMCPTA